MAVLHYWDGTGWQPLTGGVGGVSALVSSAKSQPADLPWTTARTGVFARVDAGWLEMRGQMLFPKTSGAVMLFRIPSHFPLPLFDARFPVACGEAGGLARAGFVSLSKTSREVWLTPGGEVDDVSLDGIRCQVAR